MGKMFVSLKGRLSWWAVKQLMVISDKPTGHKGGRILKTHKLYNMCVGVSF